MKTLSEFKKDFERVIIEKSLGKDLYYKLNKSLDETIVTLRELRNKYDSEYDNLHITITAEDNGYGYDMLVSADLLGERLETIEEFNKRINLEYSRYQRQWDDDRRKYEYLKKRFE